MYKAYQYLFFKLYTWNKIFFNKSEQPILNAFLVVSLLCYINLVSFSLLIEALFGISILTFENYHIWYWIGIILGVMLINYFLLVFNGKHNKIFQDFNNNTSIQKDYAVIRYIVFTAILFLVNFVFYLYESK